MSRTYRRRGGSIYNLSWVLQEYVVVDDGRYVTKVWIDAHSVEGRKRIATFHSDHGFGDYAHSAAPHWYRRLLNKRCNNREREAVHRWMRGEIEDVVTARRVRDAGRYW